jgi:hypothetical protein
MVYNKDVLRGRPPKRIFKKLSTLLFNIHFTTPETAVVLFSTAAVSGFPTFSRVMTTPKRGGMRSGL